VKEKSKLAVYIAVPVVLVVVIGLLVALLFYFLMSRKQQGDTHHLFVTAIFQSRTQN
jgi:preprotein translocase subunit YajC